LVLCHTQYGMGRIEDTIKQEQFKSATGSYARFTDIDGIGPATAKKIKNADYGIQSPKDIADYKDEDLAELAGISKSRARSAIKGGGGNPDIDQHNTGGTVSAGNLADSMENARNQAVSLVEQENDVFSQLVETGEDIPDRRERRRGENPLSERGTDELRDIGQAADIFSTATGDPIDPTAEKPDLGFDEDDREKASQVRMAAIEALEEKEGLEYDEATSETRGSPSNAPQFGRVQSALPMMGPQMRTIGDYRVSEDEYEEAQEEFAQQSPNAQRVDARRRAPITTNEDVYARAPGRFDFPGVDTPGTDPKALPKDYKRGRDFETTDVDKETEVATGNSRGYEDANPEWAAGGSMEDAFMAEMVGRDVPASPEEVLQGVGAVGESALGGFDPMEGRERRPQDEIDTSGGIGDSTADKNLQKPPEQALRKQKFGASKYLDESDNSPKTIAEYYESGDIDITLQQFARRVRSEKRNSAFPKDMYAAADTVGQELGAFPAYRDD